jgi:hypothetical protein
MNEIIKIQKNYIKNNFIGFGVGLFFISTPIGIIYGSTPFLISSAVTLASAIGVYALSN